MISEVNNYIGYAVIFASNIRLSVLSVIEMRLKLAAFSFVTPYCVTMEPEVLITRRGINNVSKSNLKRAVLYYEKKPRIIYNINIFEETKISPKMALILYP